MPSDQMLVLDVQGLDTLVGEIKPKLHTHENEDILDEITAPFTTDLLGKLEGIEDEANNYVLPIATSETLGGVKVGSGLVADGDGVLSTLPTTELTWDQVAPSSFTTYYPILGDDVSGDGDPIHANSYTNFNIMYGTSELAGQSQLALGNEIAYPGEFTPAICGEAVCGTTTYGVTEQGAEDNAYGVLKLYSSRTGSWDITGNRNSYGDYTLMLPKSSGSLIVTENVDENFGDGTSLLYVNEMGVLSESNSNVGSNNQPLYLENGRLIASTASVGDGTTLTYMVNGMTAPSTETVGSTSMPVFLNNGKLEECSEIAFDYAEYADIASKLGIDTVGGAATPIYLNEGSPVACSDTVGGNTTPTYMLDGTITAFTQTVGSTTQPIFMSSGSLVASTETVGGTATPVYLSNGSITALTASAGSNTQPVYLNNGTLTVCDSTLNVDITGNASTADNAANADVAAKIGTSTIGDTTTPIYINAGTPTVCDSTLGVSITGNAATADVATKLGSTSVGGTATPIYLNSGTATACSATVGSGTNPVYMANGTIAVSDATVGSGVKPIYLSSGTLTASSSTEGGTATPIYLDSGTITSCSATVGSGVIPTYMSSGTIVPSTSTVGSGTKPIYLSSGTLTVSSSTVGTGANPVYLSSGTITASTETVGSAIKPVYLNAGTLTACTLNGVVSITDYFCLWDSGTEAPPDNDDLTVATCGIAVCGLTICGVTDGILWKTDEPYTTEGMYKWTRQYIVYDDGTSEWGTPYCLTDEYNREQVEQLQEDVSEIDDTLQTLVPNKTIGSESKPVFVNEGTITECNSISTSIEGTLLASDWYGNGPYTQTIIMNGVTEDSNGILGLGQSATEAQREAERYAMIYITGQADNAITVTADGDLPEEDIPVTLVLFG